MGSGFQAAWVVLGAGGALWSMERDVISCFLRREQRSVHAKFSVGLRVDCVGEI